MKKPVFIIVSLLLVFSLAACSSSAQSASASQNGSGGAQGSAPRELPLALKLALGTFKLDGTNYAVDSQEAQQLLPLWKAALALSQSDTTAAEEMTALVNQIQNTMTPDQIKAIDAMGLTFQDMRTIAQEQGINLGGSGGGFGNLSPEARSTLEASRGSGQSPQGGFGGGFPGGGFPGGGPGGGGNFNRQALGTASAANGGGASGVSLGVSPALLNALISFLEAKVK
jgi:hypothetical protein